MVMQVHIFFPSRGSCFQFIYEVYLQEIFSKVHNFGYCLKILVIIGQSNYNIWWDGVGEHIAELGLKPHQYRSHYIIFKNLN